MKSFVTIEPDTYIGAFFDLNACAFASHIYTTKAYSMREAYLEILRSHRLTEEHINFISGTGDRIEGRTENHIFFTVEKI